MEFTVCLPGAPRTKKNSHNLFPMVTTEGLRSLVDKLNAALRLEKGGHREAIRALMSDISFTIRPSEGFQEWFDAIYLYRSDLQSKLAARGIELPLAGPVFIKATFYRERESGDWSGYTQALGDAIQGEQWRCKSCKKKTYKIAKCPHCGASMAFLEHARKGLGLILDDSQIQHWDGTRLDKDAARPRVELTITTIDPPQQGLFA